MSARFSPLKGLAVMTLMVGLAFTTVPEYADSAPAMDVNGDSTCLSCHENLYYLYDTGKWFCVAKAPMRCANCHGGDPTAIDQAAAHLTRTAHPIINGDTTICQQCHTENCTEHVQQFDRIAGISQDIRVATSIRPVSTVAQPAIRPPASELNPIVLLWSLGGVALSGAGLGGLWLLRRHHRSAGNSR
ncbi:MAG: hypothetical protein HY870_20595 [Chloroflexi bacterium]|nr:hypothetical protein [Chloroflexota bacterium]